MRNRRHHLNILFVLTAVLIFSLGAGASVASACGTKHWRIVNSPNASSTSTNSLLAVTAISKDNVWVVGSSYDTVKTSASRTRDCQVLHWFLIDYSGMSGSEAELCSYGRDNNSVTGIV